MATTPRKKLIEVALPLDAINKASAREKSLRHGHPSTLHLWWARRPLAAARAVIFAQMVDDPSSHPDIFRSEKAQEKERQRLFGIIEELVQWENTSNEEVLERARAEIWQSWRSTCADYAGHTHDKVLFDRHKLPAFHDPFAGGGALPLEAQRLGLEAYASDLNPVAVLINKAMIEIPPKFAGKPAVNPHARSEKSLDARQWRGAEGLAEDVRYYGRWVRDEAEKRIGHLYPKIEITSEMVEERPDLKPLMGHKLTVIAWLWARTVKSPNPAFGNIDVPLVSTFMLSAKPGLEAYVEPVVSKDAYHFIVKAGKPKNAEATKSGTKLGRGVSFECLVSGTPIPFEYIRAEAKVGRMGARLMAIIAEGERGRIYLSPTAEHETLAQQAIPTGVPDSDLPAKALGFRIQEYGMTKWRDLFTMRQLVAVTTFSDLVSVVWGQVKSDATAAGLPDNEDGLEAGGTGAQAYADAISVYLAFAVDKVSEGSTTLCTWSPLPSKLHVVGTFGRQALPMTWDYAEANVFADSSGNMLRMSELVANTVQQQCVISVAPGRAWQMDAASLKLPTPVVVSTDPPYYDNIGYADLSDFFYVWLRRSQRFIFRDLFATLAVPKAEELVATPYRHGTKEKAEAFFLGGMTQAMHRLAEQTHPAFPVTIYYAFKQAETGGEDGTVSTGWDTFLDAVIRAGFSISGTWPVRTERAGGFRNKDQNALASSIVLVCRPRAANASAATRREFVNQLKAELPAALTHLQAGNIAPVDLAQAAIGPGMAVYTRYVRVLDAEGNALTVRDALALINQALDEALAEQEGDFDADSRWAVAWFEQSGFAEGDYGVAEQLSKSKATSVAGMARTGILSSRGGKVRLLKPDELPSNWDPAADQRLTAWEVVHQLIRALEAGGEGAAAGLVAILGGKAELARELAYRLYVVSERKKRAADALSYNGLVQSWPEITRLAREGGLAQPAQAQLFEQE